MGISNISKLQRYFGTLDVNANLFVELEKDPVWWRLLRMDRELYINVRKDNYINVYYRGASIMKLSYDNGKFKAEIHNNYLGVDKEVASLLSLYYGNEDVSPERIVSMLETIKYRVRQNKKNKGLPEADNGDEEKVSEKFVQSEEFKSGVYLDTEFAITLDDGTKIRIDLVRVDDCGKIQFVELKRIQDQRLVNEKIFTQMCNYKSFLEMVDVGEVVDYYNKVLAIMRKIKILPDKVLCDKISDVKNYVELMMTNYEKKDKSQGRLERLNKIKCLCAQNGVHSNIDTVIANYVKL